MDLSRGPRSTPLTLKAQDKSAFTNPCGLPAFTAMIVGVETAPATSLEVMDVILGGVEPCAVACFRGHVVFDPGWVEHLVLL